MNLNSDDNKTRLLNLVNNDLAGAIGNHTDAMAYVLSSRDSYEAIEVPPSANGKSVYVSQSIKKVVEAALPSMTEPFLNKKIVSASGVDVESEEKAEAVAGALNYQWNYSFAALPFIEQLNKDMMVDGTLFIKSGWDIDKDIPTTVIVDPDSVIFDPSATLLKDAVFAIERKKVAINAILANPNLYGEHTLEGLSELDASVSTDYDRDEIGNDTSFNFTDRSRQLVDVNFYYGKIPLDDSGEIVPVLIIWSSNFLINAMESPYPESWNGIPFSSEVYSRVSGSMYGDSLPTLLQDNQEIETQLQRSIFDTLDASTNGQRGFKAGTLDPVNKRRFKSGKDFEFNGQNVEIWEGAYNPISPDIYNLKDRTQQDSEELSGISRLNAGLDPRALNSNVSATASSLVNSAAERRLLLLTRHVSSVLEDMFRKWLDLNLLYLQSASVRVGGTIYDVSGLDLDGNYDITLHIATAGQEQAKVQQLGFLIPQLAQNPATPQSIIMDLTAKMTEAMGLYDTAEKLEVVAKQMEQAEQNPQQGPSVEEQVAFESEQAKIAKDKSQALLNQAKAQETAVDAEMKLYK